MKTLPIITVDGKRSKFTSDEQKLDVLISYLRQHKIENLTTQKISNDTGINIHFLKKVQKVIDLSRYGGK